ncbi:hypothetical protein OJ252_3723, partial [Cryptosporidium canis]
MSLTSLNFTIKVREERSKLVIPRALNISPPPQGGHQPPVPAILALACIQNRARVGEVVLTPACTSSAGPCCPPGPSSSSPSPFGKTPSAGLSAPASPSRSRTLLDSCPADKSPECSTPPPSSSPPRSHGSSKCPEPPPAPTAFCSHFYPAPAPPYHSSYRSPN